jgi:hypothetical protein
VAYEVPLIDDSTQRKLYDQANYLTTSEADIERYMRQLRAQGQQGLQQSFNAAQANIGAQFTPAMRMAQSRLGASGPLADSGYANRLNRQLQTAAFGDLSRAYGSAAAQQGQSELSALQNLIQQRLGERSAYIQASLGGVQQKKKPVDYAGAALGAAGGMLF